MAEENGALSVYVVQKRMGAGDVWEDIAIVQVPPRTKRKTIIEKAQLEAEKALFEVGANATPVRVLDEESSRPIPVQNIPGPPHLVIG